MTSPHSPRPIVHIGYHKTGTTWLQKNAFPFATSHGLVSRPAIKKYLLLPPGLTFDADVARHGLLDASGGRPPLISEENLSGGIHNGGFNGLVGPETARRLHAVFPDAHIVIGIRAQPTLIASAYSYYIDAGGTFSAHRYVFPDAYPIRGERERTKPRFNLEHLEFDRLIAYYRTLFGPESIHIIVYERFQRDPAKAVDDLATATGMILDGRPIDTRTVNKGFGAARLRSTRFLNMFLRGGVEEKLCIANVPGVRRLRDGLWRLDRYSPKPSTEQILGRTIIDAISPHYTASNERLRILGIDITGFDYP